MRACVHLCVCVCVWIRVSFVDVGNSQWDCWVANLVLLVLVLLLLLLMLLPDGGPEWGGVRLAFAFFLPFFFWGLGRIMNVYTTLYCFWEGYGDRGPGIEKSFCEKAGICIGKIVWAIGENCMAMLTMFGA